jgi:hypothetical protein
VKLACYLLEKIHQSGDIDDEDTRISRQAARAGGGVKEVLGFDLAAVDEGEDESVGEEGAEFLHDVECEGGASGSVVVEEADTGVESDGFEGFPGEDIGVALHFI